MEEVGRPCLSRLAGRRGPALLVGIAEARRGERGERKDLQAQSETVMNGAVAHEYVCVRTALRVAAMLNTGR